LYNLFPKPRPKFETGFMNETIYPYQVITMEDLPNEVWKDVHDFEGFYMVSNLGRVKSLDRIVAHVRLGSQRVFGRILHQSISRNKNIKTGAPSIDLRVSLARDSKMFYFNTRRLVYLAFIDNSINYALDKFCIINKDGNGYDNSTSNLILATNNDKGKRVIERGRMDSYLKGADRTTWTKPYGGMCCRKAIIQSDCISGKIIATYESIAAAAKANGFDEKEIIRNAKRKRENYKGFIWSYSNK